jgi:hypothetical protein
MCDWQPILKGFLTEAGLEAANLGIQASQPACPRTHRRTLSAAAEP